MIDASVKTYETRMMDIYHCLKDNNIDVYFQGRHRGDCLQPYVVIVSRGAAKLPEFSSTVNTIEVICYVPQSNPSLLDIFVDQVKQELKQLYPMIKDTYNDLGDYIDDDVKAIMRTLRYSFYRKIEHV